MDTPRVTVVGQLARDLVLVVPRMPEAGTAADVRLRLEMLGGKGANQAVAVGQLGGRPALVAVAGDDRVADDLLEQARADGIDVSGVVRRGGAVTGLIVDALTDEGQWRYLQHLPAEVLLNEADIAAAQGSITSADAVLVQLQQPSPAALALAGVAQRAGRAVVLDGAPRPDERCGPLLAAADIVRADERETTALIGRPADSEESVREAAGGILAAGPRLLALGLPHGNLFVWKDARWGEDSLLIPLTGDRVVDTTGAGDALVAALTVALLRGAAPAEAARYAVTAAGHSVGRPGGRPDLRDLAPPG
ncbi:PfkB family carbohydrate kinase [Rugosimonospora acidiphila]|uniref:PfkB family carbohydrate kinase n=1 Tax=Rugosimonospora acidiphila TaxID=556531 RepID=A0ABP9STH3_9ACTN